MHTRNGFVSDSFRQKKIKVKGNRKLQYLLFFFDGLKGVSCFLLLLFEIENSDRAPRKETTIVVANAVHEMDLIFKRKQ